MSKNQAKTEAPSGAEEASGDDTAASAAAAALPVEVRVLQACSYGAANALAHIPAGELATAKEAGLVDDHPAAVSYARNLLAPQAA